MLEMLLLVAVVIVGCILCNRISDKIGVPMLLAFILLGMIFGSDGLFKIHFDNFAIAEQVCSMALIFIMFYGGFGTKWSEAKPVAVKSVLLSTLGVALTAGLVGAFCRFVLGFTWLEGLLLGALLGSTDAASVFSILRSRQLNLKYGTASMLEVESGSNDPCAYMMTVILLSLMGTGGDMAVGTLIFSQLFFGLVCGGAIAWLAIQVLKRFEFETEGFNAAFVVAIALLSYALPGVLGGNGYLSAYLVGILLGNSDIPDKKTLVHFFDGVTGLMQMLIFFLLGLLAFPSALPDVAFTGLFVAVFLTFIARPLAVALLLTPFKAPLSQQLLVSWAGLRGAASIVFATMAIVSGVQTDHDLFHIVFFVVLFSILLQGTLLPWVSHKLNMVDIHGNVFRTFTDYSEEDDVDFIRLTMGEQHPWVGQPIKKLVLPPDCLLVMIIRDAHTLVPQGDTIIHAGDIIVLSALTYRDEKNIKLREVVVKAGDHWCDRELGRVDLPKGTLVVMIRRDGESIIPNGRTVMREGDLLVINRAGRVAV